MFLWSLCYKANTPWQNYIALNPVLDIQFGCLKENMSYINIQFHTTAMCWVTEIKMGPRGQKEVTQNPETVALSWQPILKGNA
jgi:hypothetical protein